MGARPEAIAVAEIRHGELDDAARAAYATAFGPKCDTTGGLGGSGLDGCELFEVVVAGEVVARYALKVVQRPKGVEVFIQAAAGRMPGADLVASVEPAIAQQCAGKADRLTINTRRKGLVKKLIAQGWTLDSYVMRKRLK